MKGPRVLKTVLSEREAHMWWVRPDAIVDGAVLERCRRLLTDDERARVDRYRFAADRHTCLITRALVRTTLSRYAEVAPDAWRFRTNEHGRPEIATPASALRFNLSHTNGLVVCLVSRERAVGVDVETLSRVHRWLDLAERFFAPREANALRQAVASEQPERFLEYWTLKESYIKARGLGLAIPLDHFSFDLPSPLSGIAMRAEPALGDDATRWQFSLEHFGDDHVLATAIERRGSAPVEITRYEAKV
jgi:4'-phosphopantetheinyl transferase